VLVVLCCGLLLLGSGCDNGIIRIGETDEVNIGREAAQDIERQHRVLTDTEAARRVERLGLQIAAVTARPKLPWTFKVLEMREPNAFALPGGFIYVTTGLLDLQVSDDELAGVLAHEAAHVNQRHSARAIERGLTTALAAQLILRRADDITQLAVSLALQYGIDLPHSRAAEYEADALGVRLAYNAGYDRRGLTGFLKRLQALPTATKAPEWMSSHPDTNARIERTTDMAAVLANQPRPVPLALTEADKQAIKNLPKEDTSSPK